MPVTVRIPTQLRTLTGGASEVSVEGANRRRGAEAARRRSIPGSVSASSTSPAALRRFVNVFVADEDIRFLQNLDTPLTDGQVVSIVPAVAGG